MSCATFRERILDLAVAERTSGGGDPEGGFAASDALLAAHLDSCAGCREALAARRAVLGMIDRVLTDELRVEPSPLLAAQVRQQIETMGSPRTAWRPSWAASWIPVAATAVLGLALILMMRDSRPTGGSSEPAGAAGSAGSAEGTATRPSAGPIAGSTPPADRLDEASRPVAAARSVTAGARRHSLQRPGTSERGAASVGTNESPAFPEVIVPKGELRAAVLLSAASAQLPLNVSDLEIDRHVDDNRPQPVAALAIEKIEILPLVLAPLDAGAAGRTGPVNL